MSAVLFLLGITMTTPVSAKSQKTKISGQDSYLLSYQLSPKYHLSGVSTFPVQRPLPSKRDTVQKQILSQPQKCTITCMK